MGRADALLGRSWCPRSWRSHQGRDAMPRAPSFESFRLTGDGNFLMTPDEHRAIAALLRDEAANDTRAAILATLHCMLAEAIQLRIDEQCPPTVPQ